MHAQTFLFVGPPSSGKGTQSALLAEALGIPRIDVGALLRDRARQEDTLGRKIATTMASGKTLNDELIRPITEPAFIAKANKAKGLVIDGYCRSVKQVTHLQEMVAEKKLPPITVINITVNEEEATQRMQHRRYCKGCNAQQYLITNAPDAIACVRCGGHLVKRDDDSLEVFKERIATYHRVTVPAIHTLSRIFTVITIDGEHSISAVHTSIMNMVS